MHPELIELLVRERQSELLAQQQFRHRKRADATPHHLAVTSVGRARRSVGRALVVLGARLLGGEPATVELYTTRR
jgi:hypothetical protein